MGKLPTIIVLACIFVLSIVQANDSPFGAPPPTTTTTTTTTTIPTTHVPIESSSQPPILPQAASNGTLNQTSTQISEGHDHHEAGIIDLLSKNGTSIDNNTLAEKHVGHSNAEIIAIIPSLLLIVVAPIFAL